MRALGLDWTVERELAATAVEIAFETYRVALARAGVKPAKLPRSLRIPRPTDTHPSPAATTPRPPPRRQHTIEEVRTILAATKFRRS